MVKDFFRELKRKTFQFIAIVVITFLGVGFFIGIQVTGYNMRLTGDAYMDSHHVFDYVVFHTLGIDQPMLEDIKNAVGGDVHGIQEEDMFVKGAQFDDVMKVIRYDDTTGKDLTLIDGRLPNARNEVVIDSLMQTTNSLEIGDVLTINKQQIFDTSEVTVVGFVESSLYMNMERGQSSLGSGKVRGFMYAFEPTLINSEILYTNIRIINPKDTNVKSTLEKTESQISDARFERLVANNRQELEDAQAELDKNKESAQASFTTAWLTIANAQRELDAGRSELETGMNTLAGMTLSGTLEERLRVIESNYQRARGIIETTIKTIETEIATVESEEVKAYLTEQLQTAKNELNTLTVQYDQGIAQLRNGLKTYQEGAKALESNRTKLETEEKNALDQFAAAQKKIDDGRNEINNASHGKFVLQDRTEALIGYREFYDDSHRIENIGKVFPMIFFGVSVLVTLSTISRMIDESRMQMGVYKALGYSPLKTASKYILFAGSAWFIGSVLGMIFGFLFIPNLIYDAYRIMYLTPDLVDGFVWQYAALPLFVSFLCSIGVATYKSLKTTTERTALLLRPIPPKKGQRVFFERIPFLWNRLSFLMKVSLRNLFRNKSRFLMTVLGIGGCCGLLITGFGMRHSVFSITDMQFNKLINYDGVMFFDEKDYDASLFDDETSVYATTVSIDAYDVSLYAAEDMEHLSEFIVFKDRGSSESYTVDNNSVLISEKVANLLGVGQGDTVSFTLNSQTVSLVISNVIENYANHYIYISYDTYKSLVSVPESQNVTFFKTDKDSAEVGEKLLQSSHVLSVQFLDDIKETYDNMMGNFDIVIWVIVLCAVALEVIVLMNLISMNMGERQKELATLKVLGFYPKELALYVLRENILLTLIAIIFGLVFGRFLHLFVVVSAEIEMVMFNREILLSSYALAIVMTFGLSIALNLFMSRHANRVNMSEALKTFDD